MGNKGAASWRLNWRGAEVLRQCESNLGDVLVEIGLRVEANAKKKLQKSLKGPAGRGKGGKFTKGDWLIGGGRGLRTGTLRRSIHSATPGYNWGGDNVEPSDSSPELGGQDAAAGPKNGKLVLEVGSGLEYAMVVHQDHYNAEVNGYIVRAADEVAPEVPAIIEKHKVNK